MADEQPRPDETFDNEHTVPSQSTPSDGEPTMPAMEADEPTIEATVREEIESTVEAELRDDPTIPYEHGTMPDAPVDSVEEEHTVIGDGTFEEEDYLPKGDETLTTDMVEVPDDVDVPFHLPHVSQLEAEPDPRKDESRMVTMPHYLEIEDPKKTVENMPKVRVG